LAAAARFAAKGAEMVQRQNLPPGTFAALFALSL
jgi:hypothetical protein